MKLHNWSVKNWIPMVLLAALSVVSASAQPYAYVSGFGNTIAVVNLSTGTVGATINLSGTTSGVAVTPDGNYLYVAEQGANAVQIVSTASNSVVATVPVPGTPTSVSITPNGSQTYVLSRGSFQVGAINTATRSLTSISVASKPMQLAFSPDGSRAYVALYGGTIAVIDTASNTVVATFTASYGMSSLTFARNRVYAGNSIAGTVAVYDTSGNLLTTVPGLASPNWLTATPDGSRVFATNGNSTLTAIDTNANAVIASIPVGSLPTSVAVSADGAYAYVTNEYGFSLSQVSVATNTVAKTMNHVVVYPYSVALSPGGGGTVTPPSCSYQLSASSAFFSASGGPGSVNVSAPSGCAWSVSNIPAWLTVSPSNGTGSATVNFSVGANNGGAQTAGLIIAGSPFTITEAGGSLSNSHIRVRCGGQQITDISGNVWVSDNAPNYSGTNAGIANASTQALYQTEAWSSGNLNYSFNVTPGTYTVSLKFAEFYMTRPGQRSMNIWINGILVQSGFDILGATGGAMNTAIDQTFTVVSSGQVNIQLTPTIGDAKISAIEIF